MSDSGNSQLLLLNSSRSKHFPALTIWLEQQLSLPDPIKKEFSKYVIDILKQNLNLPIDAAKNREETARKCIQMPEPWQHLIQTYFPYLKANHTDNFQSDPKALFDSELKKREGEYTNTEAQGGYSLSQIEWLDIIREGKIPKGMNNKVDKRHYALAVASRHVKHFNQIQNDATLSSLAFEKAAELQQDVVLEYLLSENRLTPSAGNLAKAYQKRTGKDELVKVLEATKSFETSSISQQMNQLSINGKRIEPTKESVSVQDKENSQLNLLSNGSRLIVTHFARTLSTNELLAAITYVYFNQLPHLVELFLNSLTPENASNNAKQSVTSSTVSANPLAQVLLYAGQFGISDLLKTLADRFGTIIDDEVFDKVLLLLIKNQHFTLAQEFFAAHCSRMSSTVILEALQIASASNENKFLLAILQSIANDTQRLNTIFDLAVQKDQQSIYQCILANETLSGKITLANLLKAYQYFASKGMALGIVAIHKLNLPLDKGNYSQTVEGALAVASQNGHLSVVSSIFDSYGKDVSRDTKAEALKLACAGNQVNVVNFLLSRIELSLLKLIIGGAITAAFDKNQFKCLRILLDQPVLIPRNKIASLEKNAISKGYSEIREILKAFLEKRLDTLPNDGKYLPLKETKDNKQRTKTVGIDTSASNDLKINSRFNNSKIMQ